MRTLPQKSLLAVFSAVLFVAESHGAEPKPEIADLKPDILKREPDRAYERNTPIS